MTSILRSAFSIVFLGAGMLAAGPASAINFCGDGSAKESEECDGSDFGKQDCTSFGFEGGALACTATCKVDTSNCNMCGNGVIDAPEQCDANDLGGATCASRGFGAGTLACHPLCKFDTSGCLVGIPTTPPIVAPPPSGPPAPIEWPPDELDVYRVAGADPTTLPRVIILVDNSSSMNGSADSGAGSCKWFADNHNGGSTSFKKIHLLQAVLNGCESATDGLFDLFAGQLVFSIHQLSDKAAPGSMLAEFTTNTAPLEAGILGVNFTANTPMHEGLHKAGLHFNDYWSDANTASCGGDYIIMVADGNSAGGSAELYSWACDGASVSVPSNGPELGSEYMQDHDVLCKVAGDQPITTYTVGIDVTGAAARETIQSVANQGGGKYYEAADVESLRESFLSIFSLIASRSFATSASYTVQRTPELFTANVAYTDSYSPQASGQWYGNVKRSCLFPSYDGGLYDKTDLGCLFKSNDGINLVTNPAAVDQWTGTAEAEATTGGAGTLLRARLAQPGQSTPLSPYRPRNIISWSPGDGYLPITDPFFEDIDFWVMQERMDAFKNRLHGYTFAADANGNPVEVPEWVLGETIHPEIQLLKYGRDCDAPGECFLAVAGNDGMLHFFDAADGRETQGLVPFELFGPWYRAKNKLVDIEDQPSTDGIHRYFLDGGMKVFHLDKSGDGIIDPNEPAHLILALGRGGNGYYKIPVTNFRGTLDEKMPIYPLMQNASSYPQLQETWSSPWLGRAEMNGQVRNLAIFPTGHVEQFDWPDAPVPDYIPGQSEYWRVHDTCANVAVASGVNPNMCNQWYPGGYPDIGVPIAVGPFQIPGTKTIAWQFQFSSIDLDTNDRLYVKNAIGYGANAVKGTGEPAEPWSWNIVPSGWSSWVFDESAYALWTMDGHPTADSGFQLTNINRIEERPAPRGPHYPGIYVVDLEIWSGTGTAFGSGLTGRSGLMLEIAKQCTGGGARCVDQSTSPDLAYMTCPITGEVSVYNHGARIRSMYFGDECGQLWKAYPDTVTGEYRVERLLNLNNADLASQSVPQGLSKDFRKIFRRLDVVLSRCSGENTVALYFGTGNVQRPNARDELANPGLNSGRDVVGLFWDNGQNRDKTIADLEDITDVASVEPHKVAALGKAGWYIELEEDERMLRDPLVFLGTAFFKTHTPAVDELTCGNSVGTDYVYAVDSCTGEAVQDSDGNGTKDPSDRRAWEGNQDIGGNLLLFTPRDGKSFVSAGSQTIEENAAIDPKQIPNVQLYQWRMPRGYER